jgi:DNA-binding MarR family transcriptional regulator
VTGLSPSQHEVLGTIVRRGPLRVSEVAALEGLNPTMLSRIAAKLEGADLVARTQDPDDGRIAHLSPTPAGRALYEQIRTQRTDALLVAFQKLTKDEQHALVTALPVLETLAQALKRRPS